MTPAVNTTSKPTTKRTYREAVRATGRVTT